MSRAVAEHFVVALVEAPQSTFELGCAAEVFGIERPSVPNHYRFAVCTQRPGPVRTRAGYDMHVPAGLATLRAADTIVLAGWPTRDRHPPEKLLRAIIRAHDRGARIVGICSGAFLLAATGLLDGRQATTHWRMAADLAQTYPLVAVDSDVLYIDHGDVSTSAGTGAAIDLCLHLVRHDYGASYADEVSRHMVVPPHREGGQRQYARISDPSPSTTLGPTLDWAMQRLDQHLAIADLAHHAGVSSRSIAREFDRTIGISPGRWLLRQRLARACALLEGTELTVEVIATRAGLSSASNLRRRFLAEIHTTPGAYRRTFHPVRQNQNREWS